jgi:hypothetical protein
MKRNLKTGIALGALVLGAVSMASARAYAHQHRPDIDHVLLISVDGMHALDYLNCASGVAGVNGGKPYCPNLAALGTSGVNYLNTSTSKPSDSFPGLMALVTGGTPRTMGVNYDVAYDRALNPPAMTSGNGNPGGSCTSGATPAGTTTEYEEGISLDQSKLNGGAPSGDGGVNSLNPKFMVRDKECNPVYPWNFVRVNTIYGVIHAANMYTAWSDKHPAYSSVGGPSSGTTDTNVDDYYAPEINSNSANFASGATPSLLLPACMSGGKAALPDQAAVTAADDYTGSFQNVQCYDGLKANAIINEIKGMNHDGSAKTKVPAIFGMNFQAVSIGQKLIYQHGAVATGFSTSGGYADSIGTPSASLLQEIEFVDTEIGAMVNELKKQNLIDSTLIIITAKHGQSPVDTSRYVRDGSHDPATILNSFLPASESPTSGDIGPTEDDVALLWLSNSSPSNVASAVSELESMSPPSNNIAGIGEIFSGPSIGLYYDAGDSRAPDILITPNIGVTYSNSKKKQAEHGGFAHDDTNVIMLLSNPDFQPSTISTPVETSQVAPTILHALGLDPNKLQAVQQEGTQILPGLDL